MENKPLTNSERVRHIVEACHRGKLIGLSRALGLNGSGTVSRWIKDNTMDHARVYAAHPELNPMWLLTGTGLMFKDDCRKYDIPVLDDIDPNAPASDTAVLGGVSSSEQLSSGAPTYPDTHDTTYHIQENEPVDRAFVNVLLQQVSTLTQQVAMLQAQNLQLNIDKATLEERMRGAANWFHDAVAKHPDLKPNNNK